MSPAQLNVSQASSTVISDGNTADENIQCQTVFPSAVNVTSHSDMSENVFVSAYNRPITLKHCSHTPGDPQGHLYRLDYYPHPWSYFPTRSSPIWVYSLACGSAICLHGNPRKFLHALPTSSPKVPDDDCLSLCLREFVTGSAITSFLRRSLVLDNLYWPSHGSRERVEDLPLIGSDLFDNKFDEVMLKEANRLKTDERIDLHRQAPGSSSSWSALTAGKESKSSQRSFRRPYSTKFHQPTVRPLPTVYQPSIASDVRPSRLLRHFLPDLSAPPERKGHEDTRDNDYTEHLIHVPSASGPVGGSSVAILSQLDSHYHRSLGSSDGFFGLSSGIHHFTSPPSRVTSLTHARSLSTVLVGVPSRRKLCRY